MDRSLASRIGCPARGLSTAGCAHRLGVVAQSIFITSAEGHSGKSTVALGVLDALSHATPRVGVFRAIARSTVERDYVLEMLLDHDGVDLDYDDCIGVTYDDVRTDPDAALATIVERYKAVEAQCDAVVVVGSDYTDVGSPAELAYNARIAANLGAPVLLVLGGRVDAGRDAARAAGLVAAAHGRRDGPDRRPRARRARPRAGRAVRGRREPRRSRQRRRRDRGDRAVARGIRSSPAHAKVPVWAIPEDRYLVAPSMRGIMRSVDGELLAGRPRPAHARGARRRRGGHVDGQRAAASARGRGRRSSPRTAPRCSWRPCSPTPRAHSPRSRASCSTAASSCPRRSCGCSTDSAPTCRSSRPTSARTRPPCAS